MQKFKKELIDGIFSNYLKSMFLYMFDLDQAFQLKTARWSHKNLNLDEKCIFYFLLSSFHKKIKRLKWIDGIGQPGKYARGARCKHAALFP